VQLPSFALRCLEEEEKEEEERKREAAQARIVLDMLQIQGPNFFIA